MRRKATKPETIRRRRCVELYRRLGCHVLDTTSPVPSFARGGKGLPDLLVFCPRAPAGRRFWLHEVKTPKGRPSPEQLEVEKWAKACDIPFLFGDETAAWAWLVGLGLVAKMGVADPPPFVARSSDGPQEGPVRIDERGAVRPSELTAAQRKTTAIRDRTGEAEP